MPLNPLSFSEMKSELKKLIQERALEFKEVTLSSGKKSHYYLDCRKVTLNPQGLYLASRLIFQKLKEEGTFPEALGGPILGAVPLTAGLILVSQMEKQPLMGFLVRKEPKSHGTKVWVEGAQSIPKGGNVAIIEDVITSAGSCIHAIEKVKETGLNVIRVLCLVDREEGGSQKMAEMGYSLEPLFTAKELLGSA